MENILDIKYEDEMSQDYVNYALSVITERALPDVKDGLKPVQRRVLYTLGNLTKSNMPYRKCARIVGDCMGKYHPHGDSSIYEALVNMSQSWKMPLPLVAPHGNFGNLDGSGAAAMRYTEARSSTYVEETCLSNLKYYKDSFIPNFDGTETEPTFLPFQVPNILVSGSSGIAVGMATNIPTHNLSEVIDMCIAYMKNNNISLEELLKIMPGPDFATGGIINASKEELLSIYNTGNGKIKIRGKVEIRDIGRGKKSICITEIPYTMIGSTREFFDNVAALVRNHDIPQGWITDIADRGDKNGECICLDLKKGLTDTDINNLLSILYKKTGLEDTFGINMNCINNGKPEVMGLKRILELYINFKYDLYNTKYSKLLKEQEEIKEIKGGLIEAVNNIDLIIAILRGSKKVSDARNCLMKGDISPINFKTKQMSKAASNLHFTEKQTDAILGMKLQKLIGLEIETLNKEYKEAERLIKKYSELLSNKNKMTKQMILDMEQIKNNYAIPRRTKIKKFEEIKTVKLEQNITDIYALVDRFYYIKIIDKSVYDRNKETIDKDYRYVISGKSDDKIAIFDNIGYIHIVKIDDIIKENAKKSVNKKASISTRLSDKGIQLFNIFGIEVNANILYVDTINNLNSKLLMFVDSKGYIKATDGNEFNVSKKITSAYKIKDNMIGIYDISNIKKIQFTSTDNKIYNFKKDDIPVKEKKASGNKLISLKRDSLITNVKIL